MSSEDSGDEAKMIPILFQNDDIIAVNKPEGIASIPEQKRGRECVLSLLSTMFSEKIHVVHRLDKETSGVILFARNAAARRCLNDQFSGQGIEKTYLALTHGAIMENSGIIDRPLRQFGPRRVGVDYQRGRPCRTEFHVEERFASYTLVKAHPITGRRHQIRVHFYSIGHPIVGDPRYGDKALQSMFPRLMLHAEKITCSLPSGDEATIEAPIPESFKAVIEMHKANREIEVQWNY